MLIDKIIAEAATNKTIIFFDMDGTIVEYGAGEKQDILGNKQGFYLHKRPIKTTLKVMKKFAKTKNITVCILSNCHYPEQAQDKLAWLKKYAPYLDEKNIHIIVLSQMKFEKENKDNIKGEFIKNLPNINDYAKIYLFEDDHRIIKAATKVWDKISAQHISTIIK
jgi:5'(3')-deoxyribonucleotidase